MREDQNKQKSTLSLGLTLVILFSLSTWLISNQYLPSIQPIRSLQTYQTSSTRMKINQLYCNNVERNQLVTSSDHDLKQQYMQHFNLSFQVDGYFPLYLGMHLSTNSSMIGPKHLKKQDNKHRGLSYLSDPSQLDLLFCYYSSLFWPVVVAVPIAALVLAVEKVINNDIQNVNYGGRLS